jgi:uncharacterized membrane protein YcaP (DUF421 family)
VSCVFVRTIILYFVVNIALRLMGKRQMGELQPSEFVVALLISELAAIPMQDIGMPVINGIIPIAILVSLEIFESFITLKSNKIRLILNGTPSVLINEGNIDMTEMERLRYNMDDLVKELRMNNILNINDVRYAIMETNGELSIITNSDSRGVKLSDLNLKITDPSMPFIIINDGKLNKDNLKHLNKDEKWVNKTIKDIGFNSFKDVFYMTLTKEGNVTIIDMEGKVR